MDNDAKCCLPKPKMPSFQDTAGFHEHQYLHAIVCLLDQLVTEQRAANALLTQLVENTAPTSG